VKTLQISDCNIRFNDAGDVAFDLDEAIATAADAVGVMGNLFSGPGSALAAGAGKASPTSPMPPWFFRNNFGLADTP
jgi:hypothetical protein